MAEPAFTLGEGYRIEPYAVQRAIGDDAVIAMWTAAGALSAEEASRRVREAVFVATFKGALAGVATAYLASHEQLRMPLWHGRVFVHREHRRGELAIGLAAGTLDLLRDRFVSGADTRAAGMVFEVESEILKRYLPLARWRRTGFTFVGLNPLGAHVRVVYFPGALAPAQGSA